MVHKTPYEKMGSYATSITPRPPFFLFVPCIHEIPPAVKKENKGKAFAFGHFYKTDKEAEKEIKEAGYNKGKIRILKTQG